MNNIDYTLEFLNDQHACFKFMADIFEPDSVWHVDLVTCDNGRQYIEIEKGAETGHFNAQVCLKLNKITRPTVVKSIMMLKQYKNLKMGRHEYG